MTNIEQSFRSLTPYACAKVVNAELRELGLPELRPQMFYNYVKDGRIASFIAADEKRKVSELDLATWFEGYLGRKAAAAARKANIIAGGLKKTEPSVVEPPCEQDSDEVDVPTVAEIEAEEMVAVADMEDLTDEELAEIDGQ